MDIKINGYPLDTEQLKIATSTCQELLVVAGAGSGKTFTILGRIWYLINIKKIEAKNILCISYTREAANSLKRKLKKELNIDIDVFTFHKLALNILKENVTNFSIANADTLELCIEEYLKIDILNYPEQLKYLRFILKINWHSNEEYLQKLEENEYEVNKFINIIATFIKLYKCNGYDVTFFSNLLNKLQKNFWKKIDSFYILIIFNIYLKYSTYLKDNNEYDFDDLIIEATKVVNKNETVKNYKHIIIDEYQDSSFIRFNLIKTIVDRNNSYFMAVGDDFQSIYKFSGSDINLFINFNSFFRAGKILKIQTTYRNSQELVNVAGDFIMQNKKQIKKEMRSYIRVDRPIKIVYYSNAKKDFFTLLSYLYKIENYKLFILSRNNKDIENFINDKVIYSDGNVKIEGKSQFMIRHMTIHKSKGLECDDVILINLIDDKLGFPSMMEQDKILNYIRKDTKKDFIEEERRLFYVALTRAKRNCYLFVPREKPSIFVRELLKNYKEYIEFINIH